MSEATAPVRVTALYRFARFADCHAIQRTLKRVCEEAGVLGTLIVASEGINGTISGTGAAIDAVLAVIRALPGCADLPVKDSWASEPPFQRLKVKVKREIVTMGREDVNPLNGVGRYVPPRDWNALISDPGTIVIDTRNAYEIEAGTFAGAIDPKTKSFRDFPAWFRDQHASLTLGEETPRIAMFCTGGIRCEKATALLKAEGFEEVYHLEGGILKYLEEVPAEESLWQGDCFVFDEREGVGHGLKPRNK